MENEGVILLMCINDNGFFCFLLLLFLMKGFYDLICLYILFNS